MAKVIGGLVKQILRKAMKWNSSGKEYTYHTSVPLNQDMRIGFNELAKKTFGLDFETWYQNGYWDKNYIPHILLDHNRVVANVSVNIINTEWAGNRKCYIQLGTVMTDAAYRKKGLARFLMKRVLSEWKDKCDAVFLFANDSVLDFYPKFGFSPASEYQSEMPVHHVQGHVKKLDMSSEEDKSLLFSKYRQSNPFSALPVVNNTGLLMFYCSQSMSNHVFYIEEHDAVVIAEYEEDRLLCYDIFCSHDKNLRDILSVMAQESTAKAVFGFALKQDYPCKLMPFKEKDTTLFILDSKENIFSHNQLMFPLLSHA